MFEADSPYKGKVTAYNYAIYIADAALYLMKTKPELGITEPYALDETQLAAAVALLKQQKGARSASTGAPPRRRSTASPTATWRSGPPGSTRPTLINAAGGKKVEVVKPKEGATGWSDTWMISSKAEHPNCMYKWMDYIISPEGERRCDRLLR